jgi:hypothetical protein
MRHQRLRDRARAFCAAGLFLAACKGGEPDLATAEFERLPSPAAVSSGEPNLSVDEQSRVHLTWIESTGNSSHALRHAVLDGSGWSAPRTIAERNDFFVNWADFPSVFASVPGRVLVHWLQRSGQGRYAYDIYVAQSADDGATWSAPSRVHRDSTRAEHGFLSFAAAPGDSVHAAWLDGRNTVDSTRPREMQLAATRIASDGGRGAEEIVDTRICDCCQTSSARTASGTVVVYRDRSPEEVRDIYVVRNIGGTWTEPRPVHEDHWRIAACPVNGPAISARGDTVAVAWFTAARDTARVLVAFSTDGAATFGAPVRVDDGQPVGRVDVELRDGGTAYVSWLERRGAEDADVRIRRMARGGHRAEAISIASSAAARSSGFPRLVMRGDDIVVAWTQPGDSARVQIGVLRLGEPRP